MKEYAELITSIASLLWPVFALTALLLFKKELSILIGRIRRGKLLGQEIELNELQEAALAVENEVASLPKHDNTATRENRSDDDLIKEILHEAARSPKTALILLSTEMERESRQILASIGHLKGRRYVPIFRAVEILEKQFGGLPAHIPSSLKLFLMVRNNIIHGGVADTEDMLRAIDSGVTILKALKAFPTEKNVVYHPGVEVFQDQLCQRPWPNVRGVILETETPGGTKRFVRVFPTTMTHFQKNKRVAWEWNHDQAWGEAWYKDPDSGEIKLAWDSAQEFIGQHLDEV